MSVFYSNAYWIGFLTGVLIDVIFSNELSCYFLDKTSLEAGVKAFLFRGVVFTVLFLAFLYPVVFGLGYLSEDVNPYLSVLALLFAVKGVYEFRKATY